MTIDYFHEQLSTISDYKITGKILLLPVYGEGMCENTGCMYDDAFLYKLYDIVCLTVNIQFNDKYLICKVIDFR